MTPELSFSPRLKLSFDWLDDDPVTRLWLATGAVMFAFLIILVLAFFFDTRLVNGVNTWSKPIKFALSLSMHAFTIALLAQLLERPARQGWLMAAVAFGGVSGTFIEQIYITLQAARARASHFNYETAIESQMYALMGLGAILIILPTLVLGVLIALKPGRGGPALRLGAVLGLLTGSVLTAITAGYMSSSAGHWVGAASSDANGLPVFGWSREVGDLRVAHFFATHLMQTLPMLGLIADRFKLPAAAPLIWSAAALQSLLVIAVFAQALMGMPLL